MTESRARYTSEEAALMVGSRFDLVLIASQRVRELKRGHRSTLNTKAGDFAGSNRLKHMTEAMCHIDRIKGSDERKVYFSKNRDCDTESYIKYRIGLNQIEYSLPTADDEE